MSDNQKQEKKQNHLIPLKDLNLSDRIRKIHGRVQKVRASEEIGVKYMQAWEERYYAVEEARKEGIERGKNLGMQEKLKEMIQKKRAKGKSEQEIADEIEESVELVRKLILKMERDSGAE